MDGLMLIAIILVAGLGIFMVVKPETYYYMQMSFRSRDPGEPTKLYLTVVRVIGILLTLIGIACAVGLLIAPSLSA